MRMSQLPLVKPLAMIFPITKTVPSDYKANPPPYSLKDSVPMYFTKVAVTGVDFEQDMMKMS